VRKPADDDRPTSRPTSRSPPGEPGGGAENRPEAPVRPRAKGGGRAPKPQTKSARAASKSTRAESLPREPRGSARGTTAEDFLERAIQASSSRARGLWARRGLSLRGPIDRTTHSMLLRQLYLAHYEARRFAQALVVSRQLLELGVLADVAHQDAARAMHAMGDIDGAAGQLRLAARVSPAHRKAFHWWTLGSIFFIAGRHREAASALERASRWGTGDRPLYQAHLAVVECAQGKRRRDLPALIERLAEVPSGRGYGRFVLGQMAFYQGLQDEARQYLNAFLRRSTGGRPAMAIALEGEIAAARRLLAELGD